MEESSKWLRRFGSIFCTTLRQEKRLRGVDLSTPLTYADKFRVRHPGAKWYMFTPHVDGWSFSSSECSI